MHVGKRYKLASISLLIFVECWAWHLGAANRACHIAAYSYYMYPSCFLAGEAYPVHISFHISIASSKSFSRPHFYFPHYFSISSFPFPHFCFQFPFPHFHFLISISFVPGFVTTLNSLDLAVLAAVLWPPRRKWLSIKIWRHRPAFLIQLKSTIYVCIDPLVNNGCCGAHAAWSWENLSHRAELVHHRPFSSHFLNVVKRFDPASHS